MTTKGTAELGPSVVSRGLLKFGELTIQVRRYSGKMADIFGTIIENFQLSSH